MNEPLLRVCIKLLTYPEIVYYAASRCTPALRTGLGAMGLLAWRGKRKAQAVA
jgi:hypothetical protein